MHPYPLLSFLAACALALGGCTKSLWKETPPHITTIKPAGEDRLNALRITRTETGGIPAGTLILTGDKNWYVAEAEYSEKFTPYLAAGLKTPFYIAGDDLTVTLFDAPERKNGFYAVLKLGYRPDAADLERLKERKLAARRDKDGNYAVESILFGTCYPAPASPPAASESRHLDVPLHLERESRKPNIPGVAAAIVATPVTLATDAVLYTTVIPLIKAVAPKGRH